MVMQGFGAATETSEGPGCAQSMRLSLTCLAQSSFRLDGCRDDLTVEARERPRPGARAAVVDQENVRELYLRLIFK
jgi:hypothetical protein